MRINLFTITYNREDIIGSFIDFYKQRVPNIIINIYDRNSTDKTVEIAKEKECIVKNFDDFYVKKDDWKNNCWKYIPTDSVVICNINEFIDITLDLFNNCSLIQAEGYDIADLGHLEDGVRNNLYDKFCIFDPAVIRDMNFEGSQCNPNGYIQIGEKKPKLYHLTKFD
jgi:hypothetical protein